MISYCLVLSTCPDFASADKIARHLTEEKLVACTDIISDLTSIYFWQAKLTQEREVLMLMKTQQQKLPELEKAILALHPYQCPQIIALPIIYGNQDYLQWMDATLK